MRYKVGFLGIIAALMLAILAFSSTALAATNLGVEYSVNPREMEGPGEVEIQLILANNGPVRIDNLVLTSESGVQKQLGSIDIDIERTFRISNFMVNEYQIGGSIPFTFSWDEGSEHKELTMPIEIKQKGIGPVIIAKCSSSALSGKEGDEITITYTVTNTGDAGLVGMSIIDPISPEPIAEGIDLSPGTTHEAKYTLTLKSSVSGSPSIKAKTESGEDFSQNFDGAKVSMVNPALEVVIKPGAHSSGGAPVDIQVKNTGNVALSGITIHDNEGAQIGEPFDLKADGEQKEIDHVVNTDKDKEFSVKVSFKSAETANEVFNAQSNVITVKPQILPQDVKLEVQVQTYKEQLSEPGKLDFKVILNNSGSVPLLNVIISEKDHGSMHMIPEMEVGQQEVDLQMNLQESAKLNLVVDYEDSQGNKYQTTATSNEIIVATPSPTRSPVPTPDLVTPAPIEKKPLINNDNFLMIIVALGSLLVLALLSLLIVSILQFVYKRKAIKMAQDGPTVQAQMSEPVKAEAMKHVPPPISKPEKKPVEPIVPVVPVEKPETKPSQNSAMNKGKKAEKSDVKSEPIKAIDDDIKIHESTKKDGDEIKKETLSVKQKPKAPVVKRSRDLNVDEVMAFNEFGKPFNKQSDVVINKSKNTPDVEKKKPNPPKSDSDLFEEEFLDD